MFIDHNISLVNELKPFDKININIHKVINLAETKLMDLEFLTRANRRNVYRLTLFFILVTKKNGVRSSFIENLGLNDKIEKWILKKLKRNNQIKKNN